MVKQNMEPRMQHLWRVGAMGLLVLACATVSTTTYGDLGVQPVYCAKNNIDGDEVGNVSVVVPDGVRLGLRDTSAVSAGETMVEVRNGKLQASQATTVTAGRESDELTIVNNTATYTVSKGTSYSDTMHTRTLHPLNISASCN